MNRIPFLLNVTFVLVACTSQDLSNESSLINHTYKEVEHLFLNSDEILIQEGNYLVYIFSYNCSHCNNLKPLIIDFAKSEIYPIYFYHFDETISICGKENKNSSLNFCICGTPTLLDIKNHIIENKICGETDVKNYIKNIKNPAEG